MGDRKTSWQNVSDWYGKAVGVDGHYYHRTVILPGSLELLALDAGSSLLDLACGQGVLGRQVPPEVHYLGLDVAPALIQQARRLDRAPNHVYQVADVSQDMTVKKTDFTHAAIILSLQNVAKPEGVIRNASKHLRTHGKFLLVINHPCFRIPRQSSWEIDEQKKTEYRRIDRYMTPLEVPIRTHPGKGRASQSTWTHHLPLSSYSRLMHQNGFAIEQLEEWVSDRASTGGAARMENRARREFPLFLAILAHKD